MKTIFTIFFAILAFIATEAQIGGPYILRYIPHNSTNATPYLISHIISDYGPRNVPPTMTYWHRGIDYQPNKQRGNKILSPCNGTIRTIRKEGSMFYMIIEGDAGERHFGYGHLFNNMTSITIGNFWEEGPAGREMAIFNENGIDLGEMNGLLLKKIEELTLYLLEQDRKINTLQTELQQIKTAGINN